MMFHRVILLVALTWALIPVCTTPVQAVILFTHEFESDAQGWGDRDAGEMDVSYADGFGNTAGSMRGDFDEDVFDPETDAWRLSAIPNGSDLTQSGTYDLTSFTFQFYAANVVPSDLSIRFGNNDHTFFRGFTVTQDDYWYTFTAPLTSANGWFGGTQAAFDSVLLNTTFIEIQVTRGSYDAETYYFDNFALNAVPAGEGGGGEGGPSVIPEPSTIQFVLLLAVLWAAMRRGQRFNVGELAHE